jgi:hypothetical protein
VLESEDCQNEDLLYLLFSDDYQTFTLKLKLVRARDRRSPRYEDCGEPIPHDQPTFDWPATAPWELPFPSAIEQVRLFRCGVKRSPLLYLASRLTLLIFARRYTSPSPFIERLTILERHSSRQWRIELPWNTLVHCLLTLYLNTHLIPPLQELQLFAFAHQG